MNFDSPPGQMTGSHDFICTVHHLKPSTFSLNIISGPLFGLSSDVAQYFQSSSSSDKFQLPLFEVTALEGGYCWPGQSKEQDPQTAPSMWLQGSSQATIFTVA